LQKPSNEINSFPLARDYLANNNKSYVLSESQIEELKKEKVRLEECNKRIEER